MWILLIMCFIFSCCDRSTPEGWEVYRGDDGRNAWSALDAINKNNVSGLKVAWTYRTGDNIGNSTIECNPIIIDKILFGISPKLKAFALDATTGKQLWIFDPFEEDSLQGGVSRGLTYWKDGEDERIFLCAAYRMIALDAKTGNQLMDFGENGYVDLRKGLRNDKEVEKYFIQNTSPGVIYKDLIIVGSSMGETYFGLPGNIRAYDVRTGKMKWIFNTVPQPGEFGYDTWPKENYATAGGCNAWSGFSIDRNRQMIFAATGAPSFDFHGGDRKGANLFGNSVIALNAETGKYIWHYQISHHDLWDYDLPSPPNLVTIKQNGKPIDAVVQITKQGLIFVLDREKGTPLFPVEERRVPASLMYDEQTSPTQPFPLKPAPLSRQEFDTGFITDISPESHDFIKKEIEKYAYGKIYTPPTTQGIIQLPGFRGGGEWSGAAVDDKGIMYIGTHNIANVVQLVELEDENQSELLKMPLIKAGEAVYQKNCSPCHGSDRKGSGPYPSILNVDSRLNPDQAFQVIEKGRNKMPSFTGMSLVEKEAVIGYLFNLKTKQFSKEASMTKPEGDMVKKGKRYKLKGYTQLKDQFGYPGTKPPWGSLNALDLNTGDIVWKRPLGEFPGLTSKGVPETGTQLFGGGIVTDGGLIFIGASQDEKFRAIDKETGKTLWEYKLPAGGYATPATFAIDGKQYVVIAAGGGGFQVTKSGDYYICFALP